MIQEVNATNSEAEQSDGVKVSVNDDDSSAITTSGILNNNTYTVKMEYSNGRINAITYDEAT